MTRGKDSELDRLIRGEGNPQMSSASERQLLKFALDTFGESLSHILLAGLWEDGGEQRWRFNITFTDTGAATYECRLQGLCRTTVLSVRFRIFVQIPTDGRVVIRPHSALGLDRLPSLSKTFLPPGSVNKPLLLGKGRVLI